MVRWDVKPSAGTKYANATDGYLYGSPVAVGGGKTVLVADARTLYLLDGETGKTLQTRSPGTNVRVRRPAAFGERLYAYAENGKLGRLECYDAGLTKRLWSFPAQDTPRRHLPPFYQHRLAKKPEYEKIPGGVIPSQLTEADGTVVNVGFQGSYTLADEDTPYYRDHRSTYRALRRPGQ